MNKDHWERIYQAKQPTEVSWYQPEARLSAELIIRVSPDGDAPIIDVGGGASTLVDGLLKAGYSDVTVLDLSQAALDRAKERLGEKAELVHWVVGDILEVALPAGRFAVWHDRAVFHFLTQEGDRQRYVAQARRALRSEGHVIAASFGLDGPTRCSDLDVVRYSPEALHAEFGAGFRLLDSVREDHQTPAGGSQAFVYCLCRVEAETELQGSQ